MTLKEILDTVDTSTVQNYFGTQLTKSHIRKANSEGRLIAKIDGDFIKVRITSSDPLTEFDFKQYRLTYSPTKK